MSGCLKQAQGVLCDSAGVPCGEDVRRAPALVHPVRGASPPRAEAVSNPAMPMMALAATHGEKVMRPRPSQKWKLFPGEKEDVWR